MVSLVLTATDVQKAFLSGVFNAPDRFEESAGESHPDIDESSNFATVSKHPF